MARKWRLLYIITLCHLASRNVIGLKCFSCSLHKGTQEKNCPTTTSDKSIFERDRYETVDPAVYYCSVRVTGAGSVFHQGYTVKADCNNTDVVNHVTSLVNKDSGSTGARLICCNTDGCNWSLDTALSNISILETALPFIIAGIIALAILIICFAVCCGTGCCTLCGCLGCCCCDRADKVKLNKNVNAGYSEEPSININERYRTIARPGSEVSTATALTPVGSPGRTSRPETVENAEASTINVETANEENSEETVKNVNANKFESTDGVPNPNEVENDRITRTARYYFQPKYN